MRVVALSQRSDRVLWIALGASLLLHGLLLTLHFSFPEASRTVRDRALEVILVNSRSAKKPSEAQALAQAHLDGGGNSETARRATTPLPPSSSQKSGSELEQRQRRVRELEARQKQLLAETRSTLIAPAQASPEHQPEPTPPTPSGRDLASAALAMARYEAEIARNIDEYNKRPRKKSIGVRTEEYRFARYVEDWRLKVERVGTLNYPEAARGKVYGSLVLTVVILADGSVDRIEINRPSGHQLLDDAARRIVRMASPFAAFPADIRADTDVIEITRTWNFTRQNSLETANR